MLDLPKAGHAVLFCYAGLAVGDLMSGLISQYLKSRKKVVYLFLSFCILMIGVYLLQSGSTLNQFYALCTLLGMAAGYWAIFVTIAAEQFGTNIRATVATTVPNFVRGSVIPLTLSFQALIPALGMIASAFWVGGITLLLALLGLVGLEETFHKDLDYIELR
jgi:MFS family permease